MASPLPLSLHALQPDAQCAAEAAACDAGTPVAAFRHMQTSDSIAQWWRGRSIVMQAGLPRVLVADTGAAVREFHAAVGGEVQIIAAHTLDLGATSEAQLHESYRCLGVDLFCNLFDDAQHEGAAAARDRLRRILRGVLAL